MGFFNRNAGRQLTIKIAGTGYIGDLRFDSTLNLEAQLDGSEELFARYFFTIYHCGHDDDSAGINQRRGQLRL